MLIPFMQDQLNALVAKLTVRVRNVIGVELLLFFSRLSEPRRKGAGPRSLTVAARSYPCVAILEEAGRASLRFVSDSLGTPGGKNPASPS